MQRGLRILGACLLLTFLNACTSDVQGPTDGGSSIDFGGPPPKADMGMPPPPPPDMGRPQDLGMPEDMGMGPPPPPMDLGQPQDMGPDAGPEDTGIMPDGATPDGAMPDAGTPDAAMSDVGVPDAGMPDAGMGGCVIGDEGCLCGFGLTCNDPGLTCLDTSNGTSPPQQRIHICIRECTNDPGCALGSTAGNTLCRPVFFGTTACVSAEETEGRTINMSRRLGGPMTGCTQGLLALPDYVGFNLEPDQGSCGRPCDPAAPMGGLNSCPMQYPYCNPSFLNSPITPGVCTLRPARAGDTCSRSSAVGLCDTSTSAVGTSTAGGFLTCVGLPEDIFDPLDPSDEQLAGICSAVCQLASPDCSHVSDPGSGPSTCMPIGPTNPTLGFCSNECNDSPNNCQGQSVFGVGSTCTGDIRFTAGFEFSLCRAVNPPPIAEWDWMNAPAERCLDVPGGATRCEAGTRCFNDNLGGVCLRPCATTPPMQTGCEQGINPTCDPTRVGVPTDGLGLCVP